MVLEPREKVRKALMWRSCDEVVEVPVRLHEERPVEVAEVQRVPLVQTSDFKMSRKISY